MRKRPINPAYAEEEFFRVRAASGDITRARAILNRAGNEPPRQGDEIVETKRKASRSKNRKPNGPG